MSALPYTFVVIVFVLNTFQRSEGNVSEKMEGLQTNLDEVNSIMEKVETETQGAFDSLYNLPEQLKQELRLNDLRKYTVRLNALYEKYKNYSKNITRFEQQTLEDFAEAAISQEKYSVGDLVNQLHALIVPPENGLGDNGIRHSIASSLQNIAFAEHCQLNQSPHQILYNIYQCIALMEMKGFAMKQFSYLLLIMYNKGDFTSETQQLRYEYEDSMDEIKSRRNVIQPLSQVIWKCDPDLQEEGSTYLEVTQLLQGYIQNEVDLNSEGLCTGTCGTVQSPTKSYDCHEELCLQQRKCNGDIVNCASMPQQAITLCLAPLSSSLRYPHMTYNSYPTWNSSDGFGRKEQCSNIEMFTYYNIPDLIQAFITCEYCFCLCDEQGEHSDRYFNMRPVMADIKNNRVVTGLRFVKKNRIIHLQIQEGKLLPSGNIDASTVRWVPAEDYRITDQNILNGRDYHTLSRTERGIDLDDVLTPKGYVLTGIGFETIRSRLRLSINANAFNFSTGLLSKKAQDPQWISSSITQKNKLALEKPDRSTSSTELSVPDSTSHSYMEFTHTDIEKDVAQNTVPYLDAQPVESSVPLGGAGIYHKGRNGYGGFIAPKIMTYDFSQHL